MTLLIRGGTVVTAEQSVRADVLCQNGTIAAVGARSGGPDRRRGSSMPAACW